MNTYTQLKLDDKVIINIDNKLSKYIKRITESKYISLEFDKTYNFYIVIINGAKFVYNYITNISFDQSFCSDWKLSIRDYYDSGPYANIELYDNSKVTIFVTEDNEIDIKIEYK